MIGSTLSHYTIEGRLGEGGMGTVYLARDTLLGRTVAIKVLSPAAARDPDLAGRLVREAKAASSLNHPNIVTIHEIGRSDDIDFIVMEHVSGEPLVGAIPPGGLPLETALEYACQIAGALAAAHEAGIVHRDVKPANVIVSRTGHVKILYFGIARRAPQQTDDGQTGVQTIDSGRITRPGMAIGTVGYMAPEQIEGKAADARSDVFSLGVLIFELLTGQQPFSGDSTWAVMAATMGGEVPAIGGLRPETPPELARIVTRCLSRRPEERYPSAREVADDLIALRSKATAVPSPPRSRLAQAGIAAAVIVALAGAGSFVWSRVRDSRLRWVHDVAVPEIGRLTDQGDLGGAYRLAQRALTMAPGDAQLSQLWNNLTRELSIKSEPPGADVAFRGYLGSATDWIPLGRTPVQLARVPFGLLRWRATKPGYEPMEIAPDEPNTLEFRMVPTGTGVPGMVQVPKGSFDLDSTNESAELPDYWIDQYEVTNRQFKQFVDRGGYRTREYWKEPFVKDDRTLPWEEAMSLFRDATGRSGPSTWELGSYPDGQDDFPVSGVSWYEAAAFAEFSGKSLPTAYHWYNASGAFGVFSEILDASNFSGKGPTRVGSSSGLGPYGTYDMAGNVKEWCWNAAHGGRRYVLGGAWYDATYQFRDEDAQPPFERRAGYGFRCIEQQEAMAANLRKPIETLERDPASLKPVGDEVFNAYVRLYDYDQAPLDTAVESIDDTNPSWRRERVSFRAGYVNERVPAYVFVPKTGSPPYQAVVMFPGSNAVMAQSSRNLWLRWADFLVKSGRVLIYPVYQGTYERRLTGPRGPAVLRDIMIQRGKDVRRTLDYLETRSDIDAHRIAFYGVSLGAQLGPLFLGIEPRFRTGVLLSGGFETWDIPPEADPVNFAPRVKVPVLMVNGRQDFDLPFETAQVPMFNMLGTPAADKRHAVFEGGHIPLHPQEPMKEMLDWLDRYLGPVEGTR